MKKISVLTLSLFLCSCTTTLGRRAPASNVSGFYKNTNFVYNKENRRCENEFGESGFNTINFSINRKTHELPELVNTDNIGKANGYYTDDYGGPVADFRCVLFKDLDLRNIDLRDLVSYRYKNKKANLSPYLVTVDLRGAVFENVNLKGARLGGYGLGNTLSFITFKNTNMTGINLENLRESQIIDSSLGPDSRTYTTIKDSYIEGSTFKDIFFHKSIIENNIIINSKFENVFFHNSGFDYNKIFNTKFDSIFVQKKLSRNFEDNKDITSWFKKIDSESMPIDQIIKLVRSTKFLKSYFTHDYLEVTPLTKEQVRDGYIFDAELRAKRN